MLILLGEGCLVELGSELGSWQLQNWSVYTRHRRRPWKQFCCIKVSTKMSSQVLCDWTAPSFAEGMSPPNHPSYQKRWMVKPSLLGVFQPNICSIFITTRSWCRQWSMDMCRCRSWLFWCNLVTSWSCSFGWLLSRFLRSKLSSTHHPGVYILCFLGCCLYYLETWMPKSWAPTLSLQW